MTELARRDGEAVVTIANPLTGETLDLHAPTDQLAAAIDAVKEQKSRLDEFASTIKREILERMDHEAAYTYRGGGFKVTGDGPRQPGYDGEKLYEALAPLVKAGEIGKEAMKRAVEMIPTYKVKKVGINALAKLGRADVTAALAAAEVPNEKPRAVSVSRAD